MAERRKKRTPVPDSHRGLLDAPVGALATVGADGFPQVTAVWFLWDQEEGVVRFSLNTARQKVRNLRARPEASFLIIDPANPYKTVEVRGRVEIEADDEYEFAGQVGKKYGGADLKQMDRAGETRVKVTLRPEKVNTWGE